MADIEKVIKGLEFTKAMITFNPSTGEDVDPGNLNEADKTTYDACVGAIELLKKQEQIINSLKSDLQETLKVVSEQSNVIRCKDCKYGHHIINTVNGEVRIYRVLCTKPYVERGNAVHEPDWFCADGEQSTEV